MIKRPALRYHGGKWRLAKWVLSYFPDHRVYVEPFGGAASILLQKRRSYAEIYNDMWGEVVNLFRVLQDRVSSAELERRLRLTPYARDEFILAYEKSECKIERARRMLIRSFMGHGSASMNETNKTGFRNDSMRSGTTPAQDWKNWPGQITAITNRLQGVCIENRPALEIVEEFDARDALFYVDPPYVHSKRSRLGRSDYAFEMSDEDHRSLSTILKDCSGMVILSAYESDLYNELYAGWIKAVRAVHGDGACSRTEVLWINPNAAGKIQTSLDFEL